MISNMVLQQCPPRVSSLIHEEQISSVLQKHEYAQVQAHSAISKFQTVRKAKLSTIQKNQNSQED